MSDILNQEQQKAFVEDVVNNVQRKLVMEKYNLAYPTYDYYRQKLGHLITEHKLKEADKLKADYYLSENRRLLNQVWANLEELITFKRTICDRGLYDKVCLEIENLSILYSEALAYDKPITVPPRLKELDDEQNTDNSL